MADGRTRSCLLLENKREQVSRVALKLRDEVRLDSWSCGCGLGVVVRPHDASRSYVETCGNKVYRRASQHLRTSTPVAKNTRISLDQGTSETVHDRHSM